MLQLSLHVSDPRWHTFLPGQFIELHIEREGRYVSRCFSIASCTERFEKHREIRLGIRINDKGIVSNWLAKHLNAGSTLYISEAQGAFTLAPGEHRRLFVAGGSGITPILSMLQSMPNEDLKHSTLMFSTPHADCVPFEPTLKALENRGLRLTLHESRTQGRISAQTLAAELDEHPDALYVCGPEGLIHTCEQSWAAGQHPAKGFHCERFGASQAHSISGADQELPHSATISFQASGTNAEWRRGDSPALLEFAEQQGLTPSFGCRIGICHQCTCRKERGRVLNLKTQTLSDNGPEDIQLCQSIPIDDLVLAL